MIFLNFSELILRFLMIKTIKIKAKKGFILCGTHVDATWHSGPRGSSTQAHAAPTRRDVTCTEYVFIT